jgi:ribonuclease T1
MRALTHVLVVLLAGFLGLSSPTCAQDAALMPEIAAAELPAQARATIELIRTGGPYPYQRDGLVFGNFEKRLPLRERGYYREYTVKTPGARDRGARRIVGGRCGDPGSREYGCREYFYTDDHYRSFRRIIE